MSLDFLAVPKLYAYLSCRLEHNVFPSPCDVDDATEEAHNNTEACYPAADGGLGVTARRIVQDCEYVDGCVPWWAVCSILSGQYVLARLLASGWALHKGVGVGVPVVACV